MIYEFYAGRLKGVLKKSLKNSGIISAFPYTDYPNTPFILPLRCGSLCMELVNDLYTKYIHLYMASR